MSAVAKIQSVLDSGLLTPELMFVPTTGATADDIRNEQQLLGRPLCSDQVEILHRWNGIGLDVVRLYGCGDEAKAVGRLSAMQVFGNCGVEGLIVVGADPSGFVYFQAPDKRVFCFDTDGGDFEQISESLDDFFERLVFGPDAATFAGEDWLAELREAGITE